MNPQEMSTKQLYNDAEQILTLWTATVKHSENVLMLRIAEGWKNQFNLLRVAVNKGDTVTIRRLILQIADALSRAASNPKIMEMSTTFATELMKS